MGGLCSEYTLWSAHCECCVDSPTITTVSEDSSNPSGGHLLLLLPKPLNIKGHGCPSH